MSHTTPTGSEVVPQASPEYDDLSRRIWLTRGARLAAYERLRRQAWMSNFAISLLSVYAIALSLGPMFADLPTNVVKGFGFVSVMISVFVIAISQAESAKNHLFVAEMMHKCALQLGKLLDDYVDALRADRLTPEQKGEFIKNYHGMLEAAQFNHEQIDFDLFRARNRHAVEIKLGWWMAAWIHVKASGVAYGFYLVLVAAIPIAVALIFRVVKCG